MLVAQLTDLHITAPNSPFEQLVDTATHLRRAVDFLCSMTPRPDAVLLTGDLVEDGTTEAYARLHELLKPLPMPVWPIPGNHDNRERLRATFAQRGLAELLGSESEFIQYAVDGGSFRMIGLDTLDPGKPTGRLCTARLAWLDRTLAQSPTTPTLIFMHHPPLSTGMRVIDTMGLLDTDALAEVVRAHPQIERITCGHVHRPITRRFAGTVVTTCPSTAHQIALQLAPTAGLAVTMEPPMTALHQWLPATRELITHLVPIGHHPQLTLHDGATWVKAPTWSA